MNSGTSFTRSGIMAIEKAKVLLISSTVREAQLIVEGFTIEVYLELAPDTESNSSPRPNLKVRDVDSDLYLTSSICTCYLDSETGVEAKSYTDLLLRTRHHEQTKRRREIFLILEPMTDAAQHTVYRRVGIICFIENKHVFKRASRMQLILLCSLCAWHKSSPPKVILGTWLFGLCLMLCSSISMKRNAQLLFNLVAPKITWRDSPKVPVYKVNANAEHEKVHSVGCELLMSICKLVEA